jgi:hypothetical protein
MRATGLPSIAYPDVWDDEHRPDPPQRSVSALAWAIRDAGIDIDVAQVATIIDVEAPEPYNSVRYDQHHARVSPAVRFRPDRLARARRLLEANGYVVSAPWARSA